MTLAAIESRAAADHLAVLGGFSTEARPDLPEGTRSLLLLGPAEPGFWGHLQAQPEWDGAPDPVDRWSTRVIRTLARSFGAVSLFPFGGPPYHPFYRWALETGRCHISPVQLLVHDVQGLMVSFRGALALPQSLDLPPAPPSPCEDCAGQPCRTACPAGALSPAGYDVPACHAFLEQPAGQACLSGGCRVRRACPIAMRYARLPEQSAYHMGQFHR